MEIQDDRYYINQILDGDSLSYRHIVDRYKKMVYSITLRILENAHDAEDASQEIFIRAYEQLHSFQWKSKFSTWLYTIAYRICVSKIKKGTLETVPINEETINNYPDENRTFEKISAAQTEKFVKNAINKLPKIDALLVTLYYLDDNSIKEVAEITGLTISNIKVKLFRARKELERDLKFLV